MTVHVSADPIEILLAEHVAHRARFSAVEAALNAATRDDAGSMHRACAEAESALHLLDTEVEAHIRKEEGPLFPRVKAAMPPDDRLIDEMVAEHDHIRLKGGALRRELDALLAGDDHAEVAHVRPTLRAALGAVDLTALQQAGRALFQTLRVHFQSEEELVFPLARDVLSEAALRAAGQEMLMIDREVAVALAAGAAGQPSHSPAGSASPIGPVWRLEEEAAALHTGRRATGERKTAHTLLRDGAIRVVLVALGEGERLSEHRAPGPLTIQVITGSVTVEAGDDRRELAAGGLVPLSAGLLHAVTAHEESTLLLTFAQER